MYKTIEVYPKPGIICHTEAVWQWDHGDMIHLNDIDLPLSYKAEFSNVPVHGTAKPLILTGDSFEIPAEYQESGEPVYIWIVYVDDASRETVLSIITPVNARSQPVNEPFTPQEQSEAEQAIAALNNGVERVEQIVDTIQDTIDEALETAKESGEFNGAPGQNGATFVPSVSSEGVISWTNDGGKPNPQSVNIKGPKGDDYVLTNADKEEIAQQAEELLIPELGTKAPAIWEDASGAIVHFEDGADDMLLRECVIQIKPVQEGTGDPSPTNVRPITGWTGANIIKTGKNLLPTSSYTDTTRGRLSNSLIVELNAIMAGKSGSFVIRGRTDAVQSDINIIQLVVNYTDGTQNRFLIYRGTENHSGPFAGEWEYSTAAGKIISVVSLGGNTSAAPRCTLENLQLEFGSIATPYEPYQSETNSVTFSTEAGTVYGGTLDAVRGVLTVTHGMIASYAGETLPGEWISDRDVYAAGATPTSGAQVVYMLAEPITYQLTPQEIKIFLGTNNVWADCGNTELTYQADTKLFIEQNAVRDVRINGASIVQDGVANVPLASPTVPGVVAAGTIMVFGTTPTIIALPGIQYVCGEVATLDIALPDSGCVDVVFESGSTPTVLSGLDNVRWANGFDPESLDVNTTYEINIKDGLGMAEQWS